MNSNIRAFGETMYWNGLAREARSRTIEDLQGHVVRYEEAERKRREMGFWERVLDTIFGGCGISKDEYNVSKRVLEERVAEYSKCADFQI